MVGAAGWCTFSGLMVLTRQRHWALATNAKYSGTFEKHCVRYLQLSEVDRLMRNWAWISIPIWHERLSHLIP